MIVRRLPARGGVKLKQNTDIDAYAIVAVPYKFVCDFYLNLELIKILICSEYFNALYKKFLIITMVLFQEYQMLIEFILLSLKKKR